MIDFNFISYISAGVSSPAMDGALNNDALQMIIHAGLIVKFVLLILLFFSVMSWAIIFMKYRMLRKAKRESASFLELFRESGDMKKILKADPKIGVRISIDGNRDTHDNIRGVKGMYDRAISTITKLQKLGVNNLGVSFTIMDRNVSELKDVYNLSKRMNLQFALALVQNSDIYFQKQDNELTFLSEVKNSPYVKKPDTGDIVCRGKISDSTSSPIKYLRVEQV